VFPRQACSSNSSSSFALLLLLLLRDSSSLPPCGGSCRCAPVPVEPQLPAACCGLPNRCMLLTLLLLLPLPAGWACWQQPWGTVACGCGQCRIPEQWLATSSRPVAQCTPCC
jgi:hypothetical protein